jgi:hypothetical protein
MSTLEHRALQVRTRAQRGLAAVPRFVQGFRYGRGLPGAGTGAGSAGSSSEPADREAINPLTQYFESHTAGAGITKWSHYFDIYHRHFSRFVGTPAKIVEIGVYSGGSLRMWRDYFGEASIVYGVDIEPACRAYAGDGVEIFIGDQADRAFWRAFLAEVGEIDIVVDDGGHRPHQQIATLEALLPALSPGGVYLCEDITDPGNPFRAYLAGLAENLHVRLPVAPGVMGPSSFQQLVEAIHSYPFVTVIERRASAPGPFVSGRRGTEWAPFTMR